MDCLFMNGKNLGRGNLIVRMKLKLPNNLDNYKEDIKKIFDNTNEVNPKKEINCWNKLK